MAAADNLDKEDLGFWFSSPRSMVINSGALFEGVWSAATWPCPDKLNTFINEVYAVG